MCEWKPDFDALNKRVDGIETRMTQVEHDVGKMRTETQDGFRQGAEAMRAINVSVANLAHDFGERMNNFDKRIIADKEKWGARVILAGACVAMGVTAYTSIAKLFAQ